MDETELNYFLGNAGTLHLHLCRPMDQERIALLREFDPAVDAELFSESFKGLCKTLKFDPDNPRPYQAPKTSKKLPGFLADVRAQTELIKKAGAMAFAGGSKLVLSRLLCETPDVTCYGMGRKLDDMTGDIEKVQYVHLGDLGTAGMSDRMYQEVYRLPIFTNLRIAILFGGYFSPEQTEDFDFGALKELRWLDLAEGNFRELPSGIDSLPKLEGLDLSNNLIQDLPDSIAGLADSLRFLNLKQTGVSPERARELDSLLPLADLYISPVS